MLGHIALEAITDHVVGNFTDPADPPHDQVRRACQGTGRRYETKTPSLCTWGGVNCPFTRASDDIGWRTG
jgi:hypothetical protein